MGGFLKTIEKVKGRIAEYHMAAPGSLLVIAFSGGADSVCLLDILYELRVELDIRLMIAHFNHGLRPEDDDRETEFARSRAGDYGLPFEKGKAPTPLESTKGSLEEAARNSRYRFLEDVMARNRARAVALGHNMNDQAETILMRLMRGSGPSGLGGIPPVRQGVFVRPLLGLSREEIEEYVRQKGLSFVTDPSNLDTRYFRNRIRRELLPLLRRDYQPRVVEILGKTAEIIRQDDAFLGSLAREWLKKRAWIQKGGRGRVDIPLSSFLRAEESLKRRIVRESIEIAGGLRRITNRHIEAVCRLAAGSRAQGRLDLPNNLRAGKVYSRVIIERDEGGVPGDYEYMLDGPGKYYLEEPAGHISLEEMKREEVSDLYVGENAAHLDRDLLEYPLGMRNVRPGDRFIPLGMKGHKKVKDFYIDLKVPLRVRLSTPLLTFRDRPVWVCGFRIDERYKITSETKRVLRAVWTAGP